MDVEVRFSRARLAEASGLTEREVASCEAAGLVHGGDSGYRGIELVKLHLIRQVAQQHGGLGTVIEALGRAGYTLEFLEAFLPRSGDLLRQSLHEVLGGDAWLDEVQSLVRAAGLPPLDPHAPLRANDLAAFAAASSLRDLDLPIEHRIHATRATSEALRRAAVAARFEDEVVDRARAHGGRVVKLLGDGAMLHFDSPAGALHASLELVGEVPRAGLPRCRVGAHRGPVVSHNGDLYGSTVNIAARINDYARPGEVLVSAAVLADDGLIDEIDLEEIGEVSLKGVPMPVVLHRARAHRLA